jgi:hypothetical protein
LLTIDTLILKGEALSHKLCPKTPLEKQWISKVLYANTNRSLMYAIKFFMPIQIEV